MKWNENFLIDYCTTYFISYTVVQFFFTQTLGSFKAQIWGFPDPSLIVKVVPQTPKDYLLLDSFFYMTDKSHKENYVLPASLDSPLDFFR